MQITLNINEIKIPEAYAATLPKRNKLNSHMKHYLEYGTFKHNIVVTQRNTLIDGLCSYIIAVVCGMDTVQCEVNTKPLQGKTGKRRKICNPNRKREILFKQQNEKCALCGAELQIDDYTSIDNYMTLDHIFPVCRGGSNGLSNLQGLCKDCNFQKKDTYMEGISMIVNNVIASTIDEDIQEAWNKIVKEIGGRNISKLDYVLNLQIDEGLESGISEDSDTVISERNVLLLINGNRICFCGMKRKNGDTVRYKSIEEAIKNIENILLVKIDSGAEEDFYRLNFVVHDKDFSNALYYYNCNIIAERL